MGIPCLLSYGGLRQAVEFGLNDEEMAMFHTSVDSVNADISRLTPPR